jgi:two-component system, NtrC family, sensor kinase
MTTRSGRILIVDDNPAIHDDFRKILARQDDTSLVDVEAFLFDAPAGPRDDGAAFELVHATQGQEGLRHVEAALAAAEPFAMAFVDMRMPPGWDGLETIERIWSVDPELQIVICSAYSDYSWAEVRARLGNRDSLLIMKKPFDTIEVVQCAHALTRKWQLARTVRAQVEALESAVSARTAELAAANAQLVTEMHERQRMETELRLAQKLEAVGQLASGIAHEINTPLQYVGDNLQFIRENVAALFGMFEELRATLPDCGELAAIAERVELDWLRDEVPSSFDAIQSGVARIAKIVLAMKELAHPGPREAVAVDLERSLRNALEVTHAAYHYVADVELDFAPMPAVVCYGSELNQVFLNLIVNAAHAMESLAPRRGRLTVRTRRDGDDVVVSIGDTGCGIPPEHRERIFDAFFTTKEVGRGTGQGLAISRSIVVDRHGGSLTFDTAVDRGTTFHVRIPAAGPRTRQTPRPLAA